MTKAELVEVLEQFIAKMKTAESKAETIDQFYNEHGDRLQSLGGAIDDAETHIEQIKDIKKDVDDSQEKINDYYNELLFDKDSEEDEHKQLSIKSQIETVKKAFKNKVEQSEIEYKKLYDKISGLLPGATSAGLAASYETAKKKYKVGLFWFGFILSLLAVSSIYFVSYYSLFTEPDRVTAVNIIMRFGLGVPFLWMAWFFQHLISQYTRLQEEYSHKEQVMRLYEGFSREISKVDTTDNEKGPMIELMKMMLETINMNPAVTLGKPRSFMDNVGNWLKGSKK